MPFEFGDEPSNTGDSVGVQCMANKGDLPIDIRWTFNGAPVVSGENSVTITRVNSRTSTLNIEYLSGGNRGTFKCIVNNRAGKTDYSSKLNINGLLI